MRPSDLLLDFGHPVAYYPGLVKYMGSPHAVIFFGQIFYWQDKAHAAEGVHKTREEIQHETGLTFEQQAVARKHLVSRGILVETNKRLEHKMFYRIDCERLNEIINENNQFSRNGETRFRETVKPNFAEEESLHRGHGKPLAAEKGKPISILQRIQQRLLQRILQRVKTLLAHPLTRLHQRVLPDRNIHRNLNRPGRNIPNVLVVIPSQQPSKPGKPESGKV